MSQKPCRDCGQQVASSARSCPQCGIMNPVIQWTALPDGSHDNFRVPVTAMSAAWTTAAAGATLQRPAKRGLERYFGEIHDADEAKEAIDDSTGLFFVIAGINVLAGFLLAPFFYVTAGLIGILALAVRMTRSPIAGVALMAVMGLAFVSKILGLFGMAVLGSAGGGAGGLVLSFFAFALGFRAMNATMTLARYKG
jgi:hypothetical protein